MEHDEFILTLSLDDLRQHARDQHLFADHLGDQVNQRDAELAALRAELEQAREATKAAWALRDAAHVSGAHAAKSALDHYAREKRNARTWQERARKAEAELEQVRRWSALWKFAAGEYRSEFKACSCGEHASEYDDLMSGWSIARRLERWHKQQAKQAGEA